MSTENNSKPKESYLFLLISIFVVSSSVISLQLIAQRFLSIVLTYHFVFVVVSLALFGLSMGSFFAHLSRKYLAKYDPFYVLVVLVYVFYLALSMAYTGCILVNNMHAFHANIYIYSCILFLPFFFAGSYWARLFYTFPELCGQLYASDLIGAASGCIGIIYLLNRISLSHAVLYIIIVPLGLLTIILTLKVRIPKSGTQILVTALVICTSLVMSVSLLYLPDISVGKNPNKEIYDALHTFKGRIIESKDSALGRLNLIEFQDYPQLMDMYVDGTAGMPMYKFNGNFAAPNPAIQNLQKEFPGYLPLARINRDQKDTALIIGPGGGRDILLTKMSGFRKITAVEINPDIVSLAKDYSDFNGHIYMADGLTTHINEGRNFLKYYGKQYDLIMFSLPVTNTSQGLGSYALTENYLYTHEAIDKYLSHLNTGGQLVIVTHNDIELLRLLTITLQVFQKEDISVPDAMQHIYVLGSADYPVLVVKEDTFSKEKSKELLAAGMRHRWFLPRSSFFPHLQIPYLNNMLMGLENNQKSVQNLIDEASARGYDITPVSDLSPFFYHLTNNIPRSLLTILCFSIGAVALLISIPFIYFFYTRFTKKHDLRESPGTLKHTLLLSIYFVMIGVGFMILEVTLIQRFILVLGNPIFSMSSVIFTILVGAGLGSLASSKLLAERLSKAIAISCICIIALTIFYLLSLSPLFDSLTIDSLFFRGIFTFVLVFPLGFVLGFPLPLAIRLIKGYHMNTIIPWMLAINGASSVFGSTLTIFLALTYGYNTALMAASLCYLIVLIVSNLFSPPSTKYI